MSGSEKTKKGSVLVIGGGIAGVQLSNDLAESGYYVYLVEKSPSIGGRMAQLDKTFPTNDCAMCILAPKLVGLARNPNIKLFTYSELNEVEGTPGNYQVKVLKYARYVDPDKCTGCGLCSKKCPKAITSVYEAGLVNQANISVPFTQAVPNLPVIDRENCIYLNKGGCKICQKVCPAGAIDFNQQDEIVEFNPGAIAVTTGEDVFEPTLFYKFGYSRFKDVITSLEFERILSASGPFGGEIVKLSDNTAPKKIAFLQCVGSRDESERQGYCSSVCCMYAIKEAIIAKEHLGKNVDITIFFMDMRCYGKDFEKYYEKAEQEYGIKFVRSRIYQVSESTQNRLQLKYCDSDSTLKEAEYDMLVLSVGMQTSQKSKQIMKKLNLSHDEYGFLRTPLYQPTKSMKEAIYTCGIINGPKDIPETVAEASAANANINEYLKDERWSLTTEKSYPEEIDDFNEAPKIGVFVCHCGINIGSVIDVKKVVEYAKEFRNVIHVEENQYTCSQDSQEKMKESIKKFNLNRIVVASCSPRTHEPLFQETIREAGLNKYLFEMANIRDQCSWVHSNEPEKATEKAKDLVAMAINKARDLESLKEQKLDITKSALVIGGGVAGINAALNLANQNFKVSLIEKNEILGGFANKLKYNFYGDELQPYIEKIIKKTLNHQNINVYTNTEISEVSGYVGNYNIKIKNNISEELQEITSGAIIICAGTEEYQPKEYLYRENDNVLTQVELEELLENNETNFKQVNNIGMIQCVGSRNDEHPYCSRVCCQEAIKNAVKLKENNPQKNVYIFYRDIRTYGLYEEIYRRARELGVVFIHFEKGKEPEVENKANGKLIIKFYEELMGEKLEMELDKLVLSAGMVPLAKNKELAKNFKVPLNDEGFFMEAHAKLRPVDFATDGIFLAGTCHAPKNIKESITQGLAASGRALTVITKDNLLTNALVSVVNENLCVGCKACIDICPYQAIDFDEDEKVAKVNEALCKGCGACAATCKSGAIDLRGFTDKQIFNAIEALEINK